MSFKWFLLALSLFSTEGKSLSFNQDKLFPIDISIAYNQVDRLKGQVGHSFPSSLETVDEILCGPSTTCLTFGDYANLTLTETPSEIDDGGHCLRVEWVTLHSRRLEDCYLIEDGNNLYGGAETYIQHWPINQHKYEEKPYLSCDFLQGIEFGNLLENYWLFSSGVSIHVDEENPLFVSYNTTRPGQLCFISEDSYPYNKRPELSLKYTVCVGKDVKSVHTEHFHKYYKKPNALPDENMLMNPLWSTWAQYRQDVNQSIMVELARGVVENGFGFSSHVEIDDRWETCYGQAEFDFEKFPDPKAMVDEIKEMGLKVTLWTQPFINFNCPLFETGLRNDYFLRDQKSKTAITAWFGGSMSGGIDLTRSEAVEWWTSRLQSIKDRYGIDSFKFDAGEVNWLPHSVTLNGEGDLGRNYYATKYVEAVAGFGGMAEVRVGRNTQEYPIFTRIMDRDSHWGYNAGLKSVIPTVLLFGILGYPFALPDMIGGTGFNPGFPTKELFLRWLAMNTFMPSVQFSVIPWDPRFDAETVEITRQFLALRQSYKEEIMGAAEEALNSGTPINRPLWWVDPQDPLTFSIDDQFMLGDNILVAPVLEEGEMQRDIYLPSGVWTAPANNATYFGPGWLRAYPAPLDVLPFFVKSK